jgi:hypothetical protein
VQPPRAWRIWVIDVDADKKKLQNIVARGGPFYEPGPVT